jgi:hypothetical protein
MMKEITCLTPLKKNWLCSRGHCHINAPLTVVKKRLLFSDRKIKRIFALIQKIFIWRKREKIVCCDAEQTYILLICAQPVTFLLADSRQSFLQKTRRKLQIQAFYSSAALENFKKWSADCGFPI